MSDDFEVNGENTKALFTLKIHRGEGMALLAMNWKKGKPPKDFVGFAIEYKEPSGVKFFAVKNRICFPGPGGKVDANRRSTLESPIQKFRWVHFARNAELKGLFTYRITPVFMNALDELSYGEPQEASIALSRETYPGVCNVTFTRGFVSSQAFVDKFTVKGHPMNTLIPISAVKGLDFKPTHPKRDEALPWMGFEARSAILEVLDEAIVDKKAQVRVVAYDLSEREVLLRLKKLGKRLKIIIDDSGEHGHDDSGESQAERRLRLTAGADNIKRHHMSNLQHNKTIVVNGPKVKAVVCGSTNFTWRGFFVQSNNAIVLRGAGAIKPFLRAFDEYWRHDRVAGFGQTASAKWSDLHLKGIKAKAAFSPHASANALLKVIADDIEHKTTSNLFYSLAFLAQTKGSIPDAIKKVSKRPKIFVYGMADKKVKGFDLRDPDGNVEPVFPAFLSKNLPEPFKSEPSGLAGNRGTRMHHKFVVIDFDKPTARVYLGSYNFSNPADLKNGENLLLIKDRRIVVSYMIEALRIFDHYHFRVLQREAKKARRKVQLRKPPRKSGERAWWEHDYTNPRKARDRELFS
jgi:phosphatidylserine/phosphatidylglycerophosphate/cardiolipin synthase-like enzyme